MDWIGPIQFMSETNPMYILVIIDTFSRFVELYATQDKSAIETAKYVHQWICRYGSPLTIRTDQGGEFVSGLMAEYERITGIHHHFNVAYSHEENSIVERANKEVMRHLRAIFMEGGIAECMEEDLPTVQRIMNAATHKSINAKPADLMFGNGVNLDRNFLFDYDSEGKTPEQLSQWVRDRMDHHIKLIERARATQDEIDVTNLDKRREDEVAEFPIGSYVLCSYAERPPSKALAYWGGPFRVVGGRSPHYTIQHLVTGAEKEVHVHRLKIFEFDPAETDPVQVVLNEMQERRVEQVLEHRNQFEEDCIRNYEFLLRWTGDSTGRFDQWTPWKDVRTNSLVHEYMRTHGLERKIPKEFRRRQSGEANNVNP